MLSFRMSLFPKSLGVATFCGIQCAALWLQVATGQETFATIPKASCGAHDRSELVQGQTTLAERFSPDTPAAYNCNLELIGQFEGEGAADGLDTFGKCAYFSVAPNPATKHPGIAVVDVSDSRNPRITTYLSTPAALAAFESVAVDQKAKLLLASRFSPAEKTPAPLEIFDLSGDCRHPVLKSSVSFPGVYAHSGKFSADGRTYYAAKWPSDANAAVFAIDVSVPSRPRLIASWLPPSTDWITHSAVISSDGTRLYVSVKRMAGDEENSKSPNGLVILDTTEVQARQPDAKFRLISTLFWNDSHGAEGMQPVTISSKPYLVFSDNLGSLGFTSPPPSTACDSGKPGQGFARIIDLSNEKSPRTISRLILEAAAPENCSKALHDPLMYGGYGSFACGIDTERHGRLLACTEFEAGLRVFDIADPLHPIEVAYYKPPARRIQPRPGSMYYANTATPQDRTTDTVIDINGPILRDHGREIWFTSLDNGFQVVRFSGSFIASHRDLFGM